MPEMVSARPTRRRNIKRWFPKRLQPAHLVAGSFAAVILLGTLLLSLPAATATGRPLRLIDAFFMASSATCVTGLAVIDPSTVLSRFGQAVLLVCIQVGGLGLMTFSTVFVVLTGRRMAIADRVAIQESYHHSPTGKLRTLILYMIGATVITELAGAFLLALRWSTGGRFDNFGQLAWHSLFHAISAFCNAGFALHPDNLIGFQQDWYVQAVVSGLIIAGGLGFLVGLDLREYVQHALFLRFSPREVRVRVKSIRPRPRLSLHTKFVVTVTSALLAVGTVSYYLLERNGAFAGMTEAMKWWNAWFCSVTPRTAGFNTVDYTRMGGPALLCTMVLMFIGASPGSTGGGIKTSTFGLLVANAVARWRGHVSLNTFKRHIPGETLDKAASVLVAAVGTVIVAASILMATEARHPDPAASQAIFLNVLFETFSAFGTVGLSLNFTPQLSDAGKTVIALLMYAGRIGPLTLALAFGVRRRRVQYQYADENVMVG